MRAVRVKIGPFGEIDIPEEVFNEMVRYSQERRRQDQAMHETSQDQALDKWKNVTLARDGERIILPKGMAIDEALHVLNRKLQEDSRDVAISETVLAHPLDGALALARVLAQRYGWADMVPTPGFWGTSTPPAMVGLECGVNATAQVPWGRMRIPNIAGYLETGVTEVDGQIVFRLGGVVKFRHVEEIGELAAQVRQQVADHSVYRGQAIRVKFPDAGEGADFNPQVHQPKFIDTADTRVGDLVFADEVQRQVEVNLFTPIKRTAECRRAGIPLKRGVLLAGPYGCGKTLAATVAAKLCVDNGWTFIYLDTVDDLAQAIRFAQRYQPALIFAEDVDQEMSGEDRDEDMNEILNTLDGVDSKDGEVFVVLTSNHADRINRAMLRPGRLDAVIEVLPPDAPAAERLVRQYARDTLRSGEDVTAVGQKLAGQIPALIREVVERSKLAAVARAGVGEKLEITAEDLLVAASDMIQHLALMRADKTPQKSALEQFAGGIGEHIAGAAVAIADKMRANGGSHPAGAN